MGNFKFATLRLGKTSVDDIKTMNALVPGVQKERLSIPVVCTQVPNEFDVDTIAFIWFGSDNSKGAPTEWKQGFKAVGRVCNLVKGDKYNDDSTTTLEILYVFTEAINRKDILRDASSAYYCCSDLPIIGLDDHSNQTIRMLEDGNGLNDIHAFFYALNSVSITFKDDICSIIPELLEYFTYYDVNQKKSFGDTQPRTSIHYTPYRKYITSIKSKPFLLLAGISGTGKSRIVRELARACWNEKEEEYKTQKPRNFEMVQVKPNWHDSSELIGYVSRVSGEPIYVAGDFLKFVARAWEEPDVPYFLCLDEMNLAPVEQYFAEYLSVIESRKANEQGIVTTDPILKKAAQQWYYDLVNELTETNEVRNLFLNNGICIPQNLIVVGTVNMDETTFSFSRKVLDRAMTIEMNKVDLQGGLTNRHEMIGKLSNEDLIGTAVEGVDVYNSNKSVCDLVISYLGKVNGKLEGTPFKVAYRTRNEFLLYVVNNLPYKYNSDGDEDMEEYVIARALDEITNMKILSRIEGDETKVSVKFLEGLEKAIKEGLEDVFEGPFAKEETTETYKSISLAKLDEMKTRLASGYTSYWS